MAAGLMQDLQRFGPLFGGVQVLGNAQALDKALVEKVSHGIVVH